MTKAKQPSKAKPLTRYRQVRLTVWAAANLDTLRLRLQKWIDAHPEEYPGWAGRTLTHSDTICILAKEASDEYNL